jgi:tRNA pseudouridine38-40 synthase
LRFFIEFSYSGTNYHGWQRQPSQTSIQERFEDCISKILSSNISLTAAGRTDTGVHAKKMFAHFDYDKEFDFLKTIHQLNSFLPNDISVRNIFRVNDDDHARFSATSRTYRYVLINKKDPFMQKRAYYLINKLDIKKMNEACKYLLCNDDFKSFSKSKTDVKTYICDIQEAYWTQVDDDTFIFKIKANRFLRNMVRAIVGTLIEVGQNIITIDQFKDIILSKNRGRAGYSVPAHGLYLSEVEYEIDQIT